MNVQQRIAIAAVLIGFAGTAGIAHYTNSAINGAERAVHATASVVPASAYGRTEAPFDAEHAANPGSGSSQAIPTLPTIIVRPSPEVIRQLQSERGAATSALQMPWYSFNSDAAGA